jgi:hypothetical protein
MASTQAIDSSAKTSQPANNIKDELISSLTEKLGERFEKSVTPEISRILKRTIERISKQSTSQEKIVEQKLNSREIRPTTSREQPESSRLITLKTEQEDKGSKGNIGLGMLPNSLKKAYKELIKDQVYIDEYKRFLKKVSDQKETQQSTSQEVLSTETPAIQQQPPSQTKETKISNEPLQATKQAGFFQLLIEKVSKSFQNKKTQEPSSAPAVVSQPNNATDDGTRSMLEKEDAPTKVLFHGFTQEGFADLLDKMPEIIKRSFPKDGKQTEEKPGNNMGILGMLGKLISPALLKGALAAMAGLAGLFLLLDGIRTNEWYKGLEKILGKGLLHASGFAKTLNKFIYGLVSKLIKIPARLIGSFSKSIMGLFGKEAGTAAVKTGLGASKGIIPKMLGGLLKFFRRVPIVGSLISIGFAVSRFMNGDVLGGFIDTLSGLSGLLYLTGAGAPLAFGIGLGLDALNAFLDYKAGGIGEGKKGKGAMIMDWMKNLGSWIAKKMVDLPIIGPWAKAMQHFKAGEWLKGLKQIAYINPIFEFIGATFGDKETTSMTQSAGQATAGWLTGVKDWIKSKIKDIPGIGFISDAADAFKQGKYLEGLSKLPGISSAVSMFKSAGSSIASVVESTAGWLSGTKDWIKNKVKNAIGMDSITDAAEAFKEGKYLEGLSKLPGISSAVSIFKSAGSTVAEAATKTVDWLKGVNEWVNEKLDNAPILGGIRKAGRYFYAGKWMEGLKQLPGIGSILTMLDSPSKETTDQGETTLKENPLERLREAIISKAKNIWKSLADWMKWLAKTILPDSVIKLLNGGQPKSEESQTASDKQPSTQPPSAQQSNVNATVVQPENVKQPVIQQPTPEIETVKQSTAEPAIQSSKSEQVIAAVPTSSEEKTIASNPQTNKELVQVAANTRLTYKGLETLNNNILLLVKALEKSTGGGSTTIVNSSKTESSQGKVSVSQIAQQGNPDIRQVRSEFTKFAY